MTALNPPGTGASAHHDAMVALRHRLHRRPETGLHTPCAQAAVLDALRDLGLRVRTGTALTSVIAELDGAGPGPTLLLRADMDALPVTEETSLDYASEIPGVMHACGHDAHTAMLTGAARLLHERRRDLSGRVLFAFQPGEEGAGGARTMIGEGLLRDVDAAFALHVTPALPTGRIALRAGPLMASSDTFEITVRGRGGHGALPHETANPIPAACAIVAHLPTIAHGTADPWDPVRVSVGRFHSGQAPNVVPGIAELAGTVRAVSERARTAALDNLCACAAHCAAMYGVQAETRLSGSTPVTVNDPVMTATVQDAVIGLLGEDALVELPAPVMASEDFGEVLRRVPGAMAFLGVAGGQAGSGPLHSGRLVVDDEALSHGAALYAAVAHRVLNPHPHSPDRSCP